VEAYRIERFGSVDGIVLGSSDDQQPGLREIDAGAREPPRLVLRSIQKIHSARADQS
jgi:hypothetical protein